MSTGTAVGGNPRFCANAGCQNRYFFARFLSWAGAFIVLFLALACASPPCKAQTGTRPIVFVHGILGDSEGWGAPTDSENLRGFLIQKLSAAFPGYENAANYDVYFDGETVRYSDHTDPTQDEPAIGVIPTGARFFTIRFYSGDASDPFNPPKTTQISILNKANELANVIRAVTAITKIKDVILVAHSQGGLVARAYVEGLGSVEPCDITYASPCTPGDVPYEGDVAHIVSLDTPYGGADFTWFLSAFSTAVGYIVLGDADPINVAELHKGSNLLDAINYFSAIGGATAHDLPSALTMDSVDNYLGDLGYPCADNPSITCYSDDVVDSRSQAIRLNIEPSHLTEYSAQLTDIGNPITSTDTQITSILVPLWSSSGCPIQLPGSPFPQASPDLPPPGVILHLIQCMGHVSSTQTDVYNSILPNVQGKTTNVTVHATLDGNPWSGPVNYEIQGPAGFGLDAAALNTFYNVPIGNYAVKYLGGGPSPNVQVAPPTQHLGVDSATGENAWNLTFVLNFTSAAVSAPSAETDSATETAGDGATMNGSFNPNGGATTVWFEWGTSNTLSSFFATAAQSFGGGITNQSVAVAISGLESNSTYYYRIAVSNGVETVRGSILSFTTLGTLPKPSLEAPSNGATGISGVATFSWSTVANAASYRLIIATSPNALPTDPTVATCGSGCVLNVTPTGTTYSPANGALDSGVTYYWEVHARSATQYGDWSTISSFTMGASALNDFSFELTPSSQSVSQSNTVAFGIATATTGGQSQTVALSVGNLPAGATAIFTPPLLNSGDSGVLGVTTSSSTPVGTYTLTVVASGSSSSHSSQVSLTVTGATSGTPNVAAAPASWTFSDQTVGTISPTRSFTVQNTGTGQLTVNNISLGTGGDYVFSGVTGYPLNIVAGGQFQFQVAFDPATTGPRPDHILIWDNAPGSPQMIPINGSGLAAPPTNGTIQVLGTLNGTPLPNTNTFSYPFSYSISGSTSISGGGAETFTAAPGTYSASFSGSPGYFTLASITPSATQAVTAGTTTTFTLNFTAPDDFLPPSFLYPANAERAQIVKAGSTANYTASPDPAPGSASTLVTLQVTGAPPGATATFSPQPVYSGLDSTLAVTTDTAATPIGAYALTLSGTNSNGLTRQGDTSSLLVTGPPTSPLALGSVSTSGTQANADSTYTTDSATSEDGRFAVFQSTATNLVAGAPTGSGQTHVYLRDFERGATTLVDLANDGTPGNNGASNPTISSNGQYVAFTSQSTNLSQSLVNGNTGLFIRDVQAGVTERVDVNSSGTVASGTFSGEPSISADGRFVAFLSDATNLVPGITPTNAQVYVRDLDAGTVTLVSAAADGSPADQGARLPSISADGRYVAFLSASTNLVQQNTGGLEQVFVRDLQAGQTVLASIGADGSPANSSILADANAPALNANGRFVAFTSNATNLVPGAIDANGDFRVFLRDLISQQTKLIDTDSSGVPLSRGGGRPTISADGRFVAYTIYGQAIVRDLTGNRSVVVSLADDGTPGNNVTSLPSVASSGRYIGFASSATNLAANDANNAADIFLAQNPLVGSPYIASIVLSTSQIGGGNPVIGTISLSGAAPSSGASVMLSTDNDASEVPPLVLVPPGATSATFSFNTGIVSKETPLTILTSYNGSVAVAVLTLEPAAALTTVPSGLDFGDQPVDSTSSATALTISNTGTAPLGINSIGLATGQAFEVTDNACPSSLAAGNSCAVFITFSPTVAGLASDSLQISSGTPGTLETVSLVGNGSTPGVSLSPGTVNFGSEVIQGSGLAIATLTNTGTAPLGNIRASIQGANAADFTIASDNCTGANLLANNSCLVTLNFSPAATGSRDATLSVSDNATGSPQTLSLAGNATDFGFGATATGSTSETITAGQTAAYNLQVNPVNGFEGQVSFSCAGQISDGTCSVTPSTAAVAGSAVPFTVTITTAATSLSLPAWRGGRPTYLQAAACVAAILMIVFLWAFGGTRRRSWGLATVFAVFLLAALVGCGGGGSSNSPAPPGATGTPAGTYTVTVTGVSGGATRTIALSLIVK